jgi:flavin-dependent dehydrogenase
MSELWGRKAIVVGAGMGGLGAASALAGHFEQTLVLERDVLPSAPAPRAGGIAAIHWLAAAGDDHDRHRHRLFHGRLRHPRGRAG